MNAKEARELTEIYLHPDIDSLVAAIDRRIEDAAKHGRKRIVEPHIGHSEGEISPKKLLALREHYTSRGFAWHVNHKADHPCCRGVISISW